MLWGRYDGICRSSATLSALGGAGRWGSDRLLGRAFRYLPAASCVVRRRRGSRAGTWSWKCELRRVLSGCPRGADAPPLSSRRAPTCHGLSHSKHEGLGPGRVNVKFANGSHLKYDNYTFGSRAALDRFSSSVYSARIPCNSCPHSRPEIKAELHAFWPRVG